MNRCWWCGIDPLYVSYHDDEWGRPTPDDARLFEKLCLEGFQSGLSWLLILRKRPNFRRAFADFDIDTVAEYTDDDVARLLVDASIVRHRGKIESTINNAQRARELRDEQGALWPFFAAFAPSAASRPVITRDDIPSKTAQSAALSKALKKRGWSFVGPTTAYSFMQAMGLVNDHTVDCDAHAVCEGLRRDHGLP